MLTIRTVSMSSKTRVTSRWRWRAIWAALSASRPGPPFFVSFCHRLPPGEGRGASVELGAPRASRNLGQRTRRDEVKETLRGGKEHGGRPDAGT